MPDQACRVALVGAGYTAGEHARAFADVAGVTLAGVTSRTFARAEELARRHSIPVAARSIEELWERTHANLIVVAVNELSTNAVCRACFEFPWTVLVEKPPGYNLEDALEIRAAAEARCRRVLVALNRRSMGTTRHIVTALANVPGPRFIKIQDQEDTDAALAGGHPKTVVDHWMYANSIHMIDFLRVFGRGAVTKVDRIAPWQPGGSGVVLARIDFDSGDSALYEGMWNTPGPWAVSVTVPSCRWELRPLEQAWEQKRGQRAAEVPKDARDSAFKPGYRVQAEAAVCEAMGDPASGLNLATLDDTIETMRVIAEIFRI